MKNVEKGGRTLAPRVQFTELITLLTVMCVMPIFTLQELVRLFGDI